MRKLLFPIALSCFLLSCTKDLVTPPTEKECIDLTKGLLAYYPFSGNAKDSSANHKDGTIFNGLSFSTDAHDKSNRSANFDGVDDYIKVNDQANDFASDKMSISFQFNLRNVTKRSSFFNKVNFTNASGLSYGVGISLDNASYIDLVLPNLLEVVQQFGLITLRQF